MDRVTSIKLGLPQKKLPKPGYFNVSPVPLSNSPSYKLIHLLSNFIKFCICNTLQMPATSWQIMSSLNFDEVHDIT